MHEALYRALATLILAIHLSWILFVIVGAFFTRGRPWLTGFHLASLVWGIIVEAAPIDCPLTLAEQHFERLAGMQSYQGSFLMHYLDLIVYPHLSWALVGTCGVAVCVVNLAVYGRRWWRWKQARSTAHGAG